MPVSSTSLSLLWPSEASSVTGGGSRTGNHYSFFMFDFPEENVMVNDYRLVSVEFPVFSIFIPTWNNLPYLKLCIKSLRLNSRCHHQIIVHVNEGSDGTLEWVRSQKDLSYTYSEKNIGVCYALNQCRTLATADYFLYLNDDMFVCSGWDKELKTAITDIGHDAFFSLGNCYRARAYRK